MYKAGSVVLLILSSFTYQLLPRNVTLSNHGLYPAIGLQKRVHFPLSFGGLVILELKNDGRKS